MSAHDPNSASPILVADIGGTNARFALSSQVDGVPSLECVQVLKCADFSSIDHAISHYLKQSGLTDCSQASFAVAGPVNQQIVTVTNNHWSLDKEALPAKHGFERFKLVNDFTAMALGTSSLDESRLAAVEPNHTRIVADHTKPRLVIGPGTGLGVSALVPVIGKKEQTTWIPLATEGGHIAFAPTDEYELKILNYLQPRFGRVSV
ncbi:MAG: glucokinase, partial [Gammaproteobacteria bacterium]